MKSENVRKIIGQMPSRLLRTGISLIALFIALCLLAAFLVPLPDTSGGKHPENEGKTFVERLFSPDAP